MFFSGALMILKTQRLTLVPMVPSDAPALFAILSDAEAMRFWPRPAVTRLAVVEEMVREQIGAGDLCRYWTVWRDSDPIGSCDLSFIHQTAGYAETGFLFRRDHWGRGYAGEALAAVIAHGFDTLGLELLIASTHAQNSRARRVLERLGFGLERMLADHAPVPGICMDCAVYALHRQASSAQNGA
jgi:RimJ/RimL family protein N-acetyltransferase